MHLGPFFVGFDGVHDLLAFHLDGLDRESMGPAYRERLVREKLNPFN